MTGWDLFVGYFLVPLAPFGIGLVIAGVMGLMTTWRRS